MPDTPFKAMGREKRPSLWLNTSMGEAYERAISVECEECGGRVFPGDWPFCKGDPSQHSRD